MTSTEQVLGQIAAMQTLVENFPMSILDIGNGQRYTSSFDFLIDVLNACNVPTNEIINYLLDSIYGLEDKVEGGLQGIYDSAVANVLKIDDQSEFIQKLEGGIKDVFMGLFTTLFGCSAVPYLYDDYLDMDSYVKKTSECVDCLAFPVRSLDLFGMFAINPTSEAGQSYYFIDGKTRYYKKQYVPVEVITEETRTAITTSSITVYDSVEQPVYTNHLKIALQIIYECNGVNDENEWKFFLLDSNDNRATADEDIQIYVNYNSYGEQTSNTWVGTIPKGKSVADEIFFLCPKDNQSPAKAAIINYISINNQGTSVRSGEHTWIYIDKAVSKSACDSCYPGHGGKQIEIPETSAHWKSEKRYNRLMSWTSLWDNANNWGTDDTGTTEIVESARTITTTAGTTYIVSSATIEEQLQYVECTSEEMEEARNEGYTSHQVARVPEGKVSETDYDYISYYDGLKPNELYKTMDMNAFIWYVIYKGMNNPQIEKNHMMWDSRVSAAKANIGRKNAKEWNKWYNSKSNYDDEFLFDEKIEDATTSKDINFRIKSDDALYPIIQFDKINGDKSEIFVRMPSQRYYKPKYRDYLIEKDRGTEPTVVYSARTLNSSLYKFDWDYLKNIQILHPKMMLIKMCENLLNLSISSVASLNFSTTYRMIEAKVLSAVKKIVEADDTEVEDCYMTFSNDEYNELMDEVLLSKYTATRYNGEVNKAVVHDTSKYAAMINDVNSSATSAGTTTQIKRLVTEVTTTGTREEPTLEFGIQVSSNENLLKRLVWAIVMPIVQSILTPQVVLLVMINLQITGIVDFNNKPFMYDYGKILNVVLNKVLGLTKSIIILIKNQILILLLQLFYTKVLPLLIKWRLAIYLEALTYWLEILNAAIRCLPTFKFNRNKIISEIDNVDYADIDNTQNTPESSSSC